MLTTILPAATVSALYHTITTATGLYSKKLLFILHLYFLLTTVWGWKYLFFPFKSIRKGPIWMVIAKYRNCVFSKGMKLIDTICAWHGIRAANKSICTQFHSHPSFSCKILIGGHVKDFPLHEQIKICKLIESVSNLKNSPSSSLKCAKSSFLQCHCRRGSLFARFEVI